MMTAKEIIHDLPRLAKQSGFFFHFRNRQFDWQQIAELDVEEIANSRNFEMLETKMNLVINCDLNDDVLKVLDRNFVKLFRLAQMSISYLLHCQWCLDRCLVVLQEQLETTMKGCESPKSNHEKQLYQCNECDKTFLSPIYLSSHQKRRHSALSETATQTSCHTQNQQQQTEEPRSTSFGVQTEFVRTQNMGVMTDNLEASREDGQLAEVLERVKNLEEELAKHQEHARNLENADRTRTEIVQALDVEEEKDTKSQTELLRKELASLSTSVKQLVPLMHSLQNRAGVKQNESSQSKKTEAPQENQIECTVLVPTSLQAPDSREDLIDFGTPILQAKEEKSAIQCTESESTEGSQNEGEKQESTLKGSYSTVRQRTRKKVYQSQELKVPEQPPRPTPRTKSASLRRQKTMVVEVPNVTENQSEEKHVPASQVTKVAKLVAEEAMTKVQEMRDRIVEAKTGTERNEELMSKLRHEKAWLDTKAMSSDSDEEEQPPPRIKKQNLLEEPDDPQENHEESIIKKTAKGKVPKKPSFFKNLVKGSPKLKGFKSTLKKSWSNLYEASRRKQDDVRNLLGGSRSEGNLSGRAEQNGDEGVESLLGVRAKLRALGVDPEWAGITDETLDRAMDAMRHNKTTKSKAWPGYSTMEKHVDEENLSKRSLSNFTDDTTPRLKMYDTSESDSDSNYSATIIKAPVDKIDPKGPEKLNLHENGKNPKQTVPSPSKESFSSGSPVRVTPGMSEERAGPAGKWILNSAAGPSKGFDFLTPKEHGNFHSDTSNRSSLETNFYKTVEFSPSKTKEPIKDMVDSFLRKEELRDNQKVQEKPEQTSRNLKDSATKIIKKPGTMYTVEDSSFIESIEETPPKAVSGGEIKDPAMVAPLKIGETPKRDTDLSIFQAGNIKKKAATSSDSDEDARKTETSKLKSAIQSKNKEEIRKRVVFADNFPLEVSATSSALLNIPEAADSSSDWDISM